MKRILLFIALCLCLCGCAGQKEPVGTNDLPSESSVTTAGILDSGSELAADSGGALACFRSPAEGDMVCFYPMGNRILMFASSGEDTRLTLLSGAGLVPEKTVSLGLPYFLSSDSLRIGTDRISFYDPEMGATVVLDGELNRIFTISAPDGLLGLPLLSDDGAELYFCTAEGVRVQEVSTGISRMLYQREFRDAGLSGLLLDGSVLVCDCFDDGLESLFLSTDNGTPLGTSDYGARVVSASDRYYAAFYNGVFQELPFGVSGVSPRSLNLPKAETFLFYLPEQNAALSSFYDTDTNTVTLYRYDLNTGRRSARMTLSRVGVPSQAFSAGDGRIFLTLYDERTMQDTLCLWDWQSCPVSDDTTYTGDFYTAEFPDLDGLAQCQAEAREISSRRGISVKIWQDAVETPPWDYRLEPEYLVPRIREELEALDEHLSHYPDGFLAELGENFDSLSICIVRSITGNGAADSLEYVAGLQYWEGAAGFLALATGEDTERTLYHELCHLIDTQVINRTDAYDNWDNLNPGDFTYDLSYVANQSRDGSKYLIPGSEAFIDTYSMSVPKEDRARIMEYAMTGGHEDLFRSSILQSKLRRMCIGIREAFGLENSPEPLLWEQYLWKPVTNP